MSLINIYFNCLITLNCQLKVNKLYNLCIHVSFFFTYLNIKACLFIISIFIIFKIIIVILQTVNQYKSFDSWHRLIKGELAPKWVWSTVLPYWTRKPSSILKYTFSQPVLCNALVTLLLNSWNSQNNNQNSNKIPIYSNRLCAYDMKNSCCLYRMAFSFLEICFFVLEIPTFLYYAN